MEGYFAAKKKLFAGLAAGKKRAAAVINIDDTFGARLAGSTGVEIEFTYALEKTARLRATKIELSAEGSRFLVETPERRFAVRLPLIGRHNIYTALAAVGAGIALQIDVVKIQAALNAMPPVPGRLEKVSAGQPFGVYVDYAHTDDALRNVLTTLREITRGRVLLTFGCGGSRDESRLWGCSLAVGQPRWVEGGPEFGQVRCGEVLVIEITEIFSIYLTADS